MINLRRGGPLRIAVACGLFSIGTLILHAQDHPNERVFPQSKLTIEKTLKTIQPNLLGRLPVLDGFATSDHLDRYTRGYYQANVEVFPTPNGSLVRITAKVTAWYSDPATSRSGYQLLPSNGRLEADILDQLAEQLTKSAQEKAQAASAASPRTAPAQTESAAPSSESPDKGSFSSSLNQSLEAQELASRQVAQTPNTPVGDKDLRAEADGLEEILKNQSRPKNLVAVKKSGTPVVDKPSLTAKPLFTASVHDEFEMLDFNQDWVHVRISGLSRGWIWRNSLEMPEGIPETAPHSAPGLAVGELFRVTREEIAMFPGDWPALRGKNVKILSVQRSDNDSKETALQDKLAYAKDLLEKDLLEKNYSEIRQKPQDMAGIVLIFDSADGGMIAVTLATLQQWKAGSLSDAALWHNCFFDPPETFTASGSLGTQ
jgi:hypothetical protein